MPEDMFSLIFPLLYRYALNELLHPLRAVFPHLLCNVAVNVERKGGGGMAQIALDCLNIIAGLDRGNGICVPLRYNNDKPEESRIFKGFQGFKPDF